MATAPAPKCLGNFDAAAAGGPRTVRLGRHLTCSCAATRRAPRPVPLGWRRRFGAQEMMTRKPHLPYLALQFFGFFLSLPRARAGACQSFRPSHGACSVPRPPPLLAAQARRGLHAAGGAALDRRGPSSHVTFPLGTTFHHCHFLPLRFPNLHLSRPTRFCLPFPRSPRGHAAYGAVGASPRGFAAAPPPQWWRLCLFLVCLAVSGAAWC